MSESLVTDIRVTNVREAQRLLMDYFNAYKTGAEDVGKLNKEMKEVATPIYGARRALMLMRTEWRVMHAAWVEGSRVLRDIGRIGSTVTQVWQAYTIGMIRVEQAERDIRETTLDLAEATDRYNRYLEVFGEDSQYTLDALDDMRKAEEANRESLERLRDASDKAGVGLIGMGLNAVGIVGDFAALAFHLSNLKQILVGSKGLTDALLAAQTAFTGLGWAGAAAIAAIGLAPAAVTAAFEAITPEVQKEAFREATENLGVMALEIRGGMGEIGKDIMEDIREMQQVTPHGGRFGGQFGIPDVPYAGLYYLHPHEEVRTSTAKRLEGSAERRLSRPTIREVRITNYFSGDIHGIDDLERAGEVQYRKFMRKLEAVR